MAEEGTSAEHVQQASPEQKIAAYPDQVLHLLNKVGERQTETHTQ